MMTVPRVVQELKDLRGKARLDALISQGLVILEPTQESVMKAREFSKESGDFPVLSATDIDLLALAYEHDGIICSDDFALHNTAHHLNIATHSLLQKKPDKRKWKYRCSGCGKYYSILPSDLICPVCGLQVKRKIK